MIYSGGVGAFPLGHCVHGSKSSLVRGSSNDEEVKFKYTYAKRRDEF